MVVGLYFQYHEDGIANLIAVDKVSTTKTGFVNAERWKALRNNMSTGMLFIDENNKVSKISSSKLNAGNCSSISDIDDLTKLQGKTKPVDTELLYIYHNEDTGCSGVGRDYTIINILGDRVSNYSTHGAALFQGSTVKFDLWPYSNSFQSSYEQNKLLIFIK